MQTDTQTLINHVTVLRDLAVPFLCYEAEPPYRIIEENAAHEAVALTKRDEIVGRPFLEVFPDTSEEYKRTGKSAPIESIKKIVRTKKADSLGEFKWNVPGPDGRMVTKYWRSTQYPIFDEAGKTVVAVYQLTEDITHEQETEQALAQTQDKLYEVLATGQVGTWSLDIGTGVATGGPNLARMFGIQPELAARGVPLDDFVKQIHPDDRDQVIKEIEKAIRTGKPYESEYRIVTNTSEVRWVLARGQTKPDGLDGANVFSGTLIDITQRKDNERLLSENESRLRFMTDSMPQLMWISSPDGQVQYSNKRWQEFTGVDLQASDTDRRMELVHPDDRQKVSKLWNQAVKTGESFEAEYRLFNHSDNAYRWVIGRAAAFKDENGIVINWYGSATDIDAQKRTTLVQKYLASVSKELSSSLDHKSTLRKISRLCVPEVADWCSVELKNADGSTDQVSVAHVDPKKVALAKEFRRRYPPNVDDPTGVPAVIRTGKTEFYPIITEEMVRASLTDEHMLEFMLELNICSMIIAPITSHNTTIGTITFVASESGRYYTQSDIDMAEDVASRISLSLTNTRLFSELKQELAQRQQLENELKLEKQMLEARVKERTQQLQLTNQGLRDEILRRQTAEQELNEYSSELTRSNQELEGFAYVASHDLQEPLRKIQAFGNLLLSEYGDDLGIEGADYLQRMHGAASRMSTLIDDLLMFSRVTRKQHSGRDVDLNATVRDVMSDLEARIQDTGAKVTVGTLPTICSDPTHMRQLFQNLIGNAIKFHRPGVAPVIKVKSRPKKDGYEITVADNGVGFDEKYLDRIFAVFQRLHERSAYEGTGIGLAVCRKIVERYDGTITATSNKGTGSTFIVWLPAKEGKRR